MRARACDCRQEIFSACMCIISLLGVAKELRNLPGRSYHARLFEGGIFWPAAAHTHTHTHTHTYTHTHIRTQCASLTLHGAVQSVLALCVFVCVGCDCVAAFGIYFQAFHFFPLEYRTCNCTRVYRDIRT